MKTFVLYIILLFVASFFAVETALPKTLSKKCDSLVSRGLTDSALLYVHLRAIDLSEDVSTLSSGDDELLLLIYQIKPYAEYPDLIGSKQITITARGDTVSRAFPCTLTPEIDSICLVLLEMDTRRSLREIEPVVRININTLSNEFAKSDLIAQNEILDNDDLLGIICLSGNSLFKQPYLENFAGIHLFDSYKYSVELQMGSADILQKNR